MDLLQIADMFRENYVKLSFSKDLKTIITIEFLVWWICHLSSKDLLKKTLSTKYSPILLL